MKKAATTLAVTTYYVDDVSGNDQSNGTSKQTAMIQNVLMEQITEEQVQTYIKNKESEFVGEEVELRLIRYRLAQSMYLDTIKLMVEHATIKR